MITSEPFTDFPDMTLEKLKRKYRILKEKYEFQKMTNKEIKKEFSNEELYILIVKKSLDFHKKLDYAIQNAKAHMDDPNEAYITFILLK